MAIKLYYYLVQHNGCTTIVDFAPLCHICVINRGEVYKYRTGLTSFNLAFRGLFFPTPNFNVR
jgi:hypothetical protein